MRLFDVLDGLRERGMLDRIETLDVEGERVSLRLAPVVKAVEPKDPVRMELARDEEDPEGLKYASS